jgi:hypothetical protein
LELADWGVFLGTNVRSGIVNADVELVSRQGGKKLGFVLGARATGLDADLGANHFDQAGADLNLRGTLDDFHKLGLVESKATFTRAAQEIALIQVSGNVDLDTLELELRTVIEAAPALLGQAAPRLASELAGKPLRVEVATEATCANQILDLRQCQLTLTPTTRAKTNELNVTGKIDMTQPKAISGALKLAAESLDLTACYEFLGGKKPAQQTQNHVATPLAATPAAEPPAVPLPFKALVANAVIGHLYVGEVDIARLEATAKLDGSRVLVKPAQFTLNGAPVSASADLDLGVAGYRYDLILSAAKVPLAPLVNTFMPERKGQFGGVTSVNAQLKGAGVSDVGLQKNLTGQFDVTSTNLNLAIGDVESPMIRTVINVIVGIPDAVAGLSRESRGWGDELLNSPLNSIAVRGTAGGGKIELTQALVESSALHVQTAGTISLASLLTDSKVRFPVSVALSKPLTDRVGLTPRNTPTNAVYVPLPDFLKLSGTVGKPKPDTDYLVLAQVVLRTGVGIFGRTGEALTEKAGALFGGRRPQPGQASPGATNQTSSTNQPANTNRPLDKFLNLFNQPKKQDK